MGPVIVEELVSVEDAPSSRYLLMLMVLGSMENRFDGT